TRPADRATGVVTGGLLGRLVPARGIATLLDAPVRRPARRPRSAGGGPRAADRGDHVAARGLTGRGAPVGPINPDDVSAFYRGVDVIAVPSIPPAAWTEQFGRVAVEAMAAGGPVVSSDAGALPEVVGGAGIGAERAHHSIPAAARGRRLA